MHRRILLQSIAAFATVALVREARAAVPRRRISPARWVDRQQAIAASLAAGEIRGADWMREVESLARDIDVGELMAFVGRQRISDAPPPFHNDPRKRYVRFVDARGEPRRLPYGAAFFDFSPTNVVTPHGHRHMVSAHLVVKGELRIRNFDRVADIAAEAGDGGAMLIRPTRDSIGRVGEVSTMSSDRDNIHWFVPRHGAATTFDVVISDLDPGMPSVDIKAIDPLGGEARDDGLIRAPIIPFGEAARKYTRAV